MAVRRDDEELPSAGSTAGNGSLFAMPVVMALMVGAVFVCTSYSRRAEPGTRPLVEAPPPPTPAVSGDAALITDEVHQLFTTRCVPCHGSEGRGDGVAAASLTPHPRDFSDHAWQTAVPDAEIELVIGHGGAAANKSTLMPENPDLVDRPEVIRGLRALVRSLGHT